MFSGFDCSNLAGSVGGVNYPFFFLALQSIWHYSQLHELADLSDDIQCFPGTIEFSSVTQICCCTLVCLSWL